jgi:Transposase, Mutator family
MAENFIEASREKVKELMERPLGELRLCAVLIDGTAFKDRQMIVALGIGCDGRKTVLGLREGATENAAVVNGLLSELGTLNAGGLAIRSSAGWAQGCLSPSVNSERLSAIARFCCCCLRLPFPRNQLRKESLSRKLYWLDLMDMTANVRSVLTHV